ncbi:Protein of unknown function [Cotesia congregata]|uniref:Uncharacterized protein n=1 Tax=Cotesia congregata TaxID=51543 RepID=A0A8J2H7I8_COTCN|nr:Protein of unknown function [Cotesia congregata]
MSIQRRKSWYKTAEKFAYLAIYQVDAKQGLDCLDSTKRADFSDSYYRIDVMFIQVHKSGCEGSGVKSTLDYLEPAKNRIATEACLLYSTMTPVYTSRDYLIDLYLGSSLQGVWTISTNLNMNSALVGHELA